MPQTVPNKPDERRGRPDRRQNGQTPLQGLRPLSLIGHVHGPVDPRLVALAIRPPSVPMTAPPFHHASGKNLFAPIRPDCVPDQVSIKQRIQRLSPDQKLRSNRDPPRGARPNDKLISFWMMTDQDQNDAMMSTNITSFTVKVARANKAPTWRNQSPAPMREFLLPLCLLVFDCGPLFTALFSRKTS